MTREISEHVGNQIWHMKAYFKISAIVYFEVEDTSPITFKQKPLINFLYFCSSVCHLILLSVFVVMIHTA